MHLFYKKYFYFAIITVLETHPFKAQWSLYVPPGLTLINSTFCPHSCIYVFCVDLRTNSDYFPIQY